VVFRDVFLAVANADGVLLGRDVVRGLTVQASVDVMHFTDVDVLLQFGSSGVLLVGSVSELPSSLLSLPSDLHITNLTMQLRLATAASALPTSFFLSLGVTYRSMVFDGAIYLSPGQQMLLAEVRDVSFSSVLPHMPPYLDVHVDALLLGFVSNGRLPNNPAIYANFPVLSSLDLSLMPPGQATVLFAAQLALLPNLGALFGLHDQSAIQMVLTAVVAETQQAFSVAINVPSIRIGPFVGGGLELSVLIKEPSVTARFSFDLLINLPGNPAALSPTKFSASLEYFDESSLGLAASVGTSVISDPQQLPEPVWRNAFGIVGFNVYSLAIEAAVEIDTVPPLPDEIGLALGFSFQPNAHTPATLLSGSFVVSLDPDNMLFSFLATNLDRCFYLTVFETFIGGALHGVSSALNEVEETALRLCEQLAFISVPEIYFYFSPRGAIINKLPFPAGGKLNVTVVLFGLYTAHVDGFIDLAQASAGLTGYISEFDLGPLKVSGLGGGDIKVRHIINEGEQAKRGRK
jgi:hypothetical protein